MIRAFNQLIGVFVDSIDVRHEIRLAESHSLVDICCSKPCNISATLLRHIPSSRHEIGNKWRNYTILRREDSIISHKRRLYIRLMYFFLLIICHNSCNLNSQRKWLLHEPPLPWSSSKKNARHYSFFRILNARSICQQNVNTRRRALATIY